MRFIYMASEYEICLKCNHSVCEACGFWCDHVENEEPCCDMECSYKDKRKLKKILRLREQIFDKLNKLEEELGLSLKVEISFDE